MVDFEDPCVMIIESRMQMVQCNINHMNKITYEAINSLKERKEILEQELRNLQSNFNTPSHFDVNRTYLETLIEKVNRDIEVIQNEHDKAIVSLERQKQMLKKELSSIGNLDLLINVLTYKIFEAQYEHRKATEELSGQIENMSKRTDLSKAQIATNIAELEKKMNDLQNRHEAELKNLEGQRSELLKETALKTQHLDATLESLKTQHDKILTDLQTCTINANPSEINEANRRISKLNRMYDKDVEMLYKLHSDGWKEYNNEQILSELLEARGLCFTPSGNFLTSSGHHLTRDEASSLGLFEGVNLGSWKSVILGDRNVETSVSETSSTVTTQSKMESEDVNYLKTVFGKPLTLALAEITVKQPQDPIHYLGHWLFKYRYNQEISITRKQELQELIKERERLEKEKLHHILEEEAQAAILKLIIRAEEEALRNELENIAQENEGDHLLEVEAP